LEKSVEYQQTTLRCIPEDKTLHNHRFENIKSGMQNMTVNLGEA
jgi:hypothetical protein